MANLIRMAGANLEYGTEERIDPLSVSSDLAQANQDAEARMIAPGDSAQAFGKAITSVAGVALVLALVGLFVD